MKVKALNRIKQCGDYHLAGEVFDVDKKTFEFLKSEGAVEEVGASTDVTTAPAIDAKALYESTEDFNSLKVPELKAICTLLELSTSGNKDALIEAIESFGDDVINLDEMDLQALQTLAEEENLTVPEDATEESLREMLAEHLTGDGE